MADERTKDYGPNDKGRQLDWSILRESGEAFVRLSLYGPHHDGTATFDLAIYDDPRRLLGDGQKVFTNITPRAAIKLRDWIDNVYLPLVEKQKEAKDG